MKYNVDIIFLEKLVKQVHQFLKIIKQLQNVDPHPDLHQKKYVKCTMTRPDQASTTNATSIDNETSRFTAPQERKNITGLIDSMTPDQENALFFKIVKQVEQILQ